MAKKPSVHIVPKPIGWGVVQAGQTISTHPTQAAAAAAGKPVAQAGRTELVTHRPDGRIRDSDSYGNDPRASHDSKH